MRGMSLTRALCAAAVLLTPAMTLESRADQPPHAQARGHEKSKEKGKKAKGSSDRHWNQRFRGLDDNGNGAISRREWNGDDRSFRVHDWNRDGVLSGDELRADAVRPQSRRGERDDVLFASMDANDDGRVTRKEWTGTAATFNRLDFNRDGQLSPYEYGVGR